MSGPGPLAVAAGRIENFARARLSLPGLAVGLVGPGGWHHEFAVGVAEVASGRPLDPATLMPIASVSKAMTAVAWPGPRPGGRRASGPATRTSGTRCSGWSWNGSPAAPTARPSSATSSTPAA